jgi:ferredoxin
MGAIIFYFSSTGNSLQITRQIAKELKDCAIKSMAAPPPGEPVGGPGETIGFVFPVYFLGLPRLVRSFVEKLKIRPGTYCFAFANYGGYGADALGMLDDILGRKGIGLSYADGVRMPGNYIVKYGAYPPAKVEQQIKNAASVVDQAAKAIGGKDRRPVKRRVVLFSKLINSLLYKGIAQWDRKFITTAKCTACGLCAQVCPVNNIKIQDGHPVWQHHCERCVACIQWCPSEAIQFGKTTIGRRRYHHPDVKVQEIIAASKELG